MPQLSIIVPVYNVEPYLRRCIDSILAQTFTDFELILIDDGSPDKCGEIMEEYAAQDSRIITIHQENKGVSAARNAGLHIAQGTYVGFVDPDDWIDPGMYDGIIRAMEKNGAELGFCSWRDQFQDGREIEHGVEFPDKMTCTTFVKEIFAIPRTVAGSNCNKVFVRKLIRHNYDESLTICEDNKFLCEYCLGVREVCYANSGKYNVFIREDSTTRRTATSVVCGLPVRRELIEIVSPLGEDVRQCAEADFLDTCLQYLRLIESEKCSEAYKLTTVSFKNYIQRYFSQIIKNDYIHWKMKLLLVQKAIYIKMKIYNDVEIMSWNWKGSPSEKNCNNIRWSCNGRD